MGSNRYSYYTQDRFDGGIEERETVARPNQLKDARNVWVVDGSDELVTRPGYNYVTKGVVLPLGDTLTNPTIMAENPAGVFTVKSVVTFPFASLPATGVVYLGFSSPAPGDTFRGLVVGSVTGNTTSATMRWEYWNGSAWTHLPVVESLWNHQVSTQKFFAGDGVNPTDTIFNFAAPRDWTTTTVNSLSRYWVRAKQITSVTLSAATDAGVQGDELYSDLSTSWGAIYGVGVVPYPSGVISYTIADVSLASLSAKGLALIVSAAADGSKSPDPTPGSLYRYVSVGPAVSPGAFGTYADEPATVAQIPQVNEVFIAYRNQVYNVSPTRLKPVSTLLTTEAGAIASASVLRNFFDARIEDDPAFVGPGQPLNQTSVPQLSSFPQASSVLYNSNILWCARIIGEESMIRWSAPAIGGTYLGYRVFPTLNFAAVPSNEPVKALAALHEQTIVFTERSIFAMVATGIDGNNFTAYAPVRICDVGTLAQSSIQNTPGKLMLFANEGFFAFDGTPNIRRISDPINDIVARINLGKAAYVSSAHWDFYNMYVVAVPLDGSDKNNTLLLYDYERGAWWVWDNIDARFLYVLDNQLHFVNYSGNVFKFEGTHDYGEAITSYATTHRFGKNERLAKTARDVRITAYGQGVTAQLIAGDRAQSATSITFGSSSDAVYDTAVFDTATFPDQNIKERRIGVRQAGRWFQLKVASSSKHEPMRINELAIGCIQEGRR